MNRSAFMLMLNILVAAARVFWGLLALLAALFWVMELLSGLTRNERDDP